MCFSGGKRKINFREIFFISIVSILDVQQLFEKCEQKAQKTKRVCFRKHFILGLSLKKKKKSFLAVKVAFCMMLVAGCKQPNIGKQLHGKNLTIKFECGGILSKMCRE